MTAEETRNTAVATVKARMGLANVPPSQWSYDQRQAYLKALSAELIRVGANLPASEVAFARKVNASPTTSLEDASFDWGLFASESVRPLGEAAQSIGDGVFSVAKLAKWILPIGAVVASVILLKALSKRTGAE